jgi:mannose-1-phosphate guanylyltransferase
VREVGSHEDQTFEVVGRADPGARRIRITPAPDVGQVDQRNEARDVGVSRSPHIALRRIGVLDRSMLTAPKASRISATTPIEDERHEVTWTLALAGGEGLRLRDYVQQHGQRLPKQYCRLLGSRSMLEHTLARLNELTPASRTLTVIGTDHRAYAMPQLAGSSDHVFCQPASRDTGIALYVALAMIKRWAPNAIVTITPTDHFVEPSTRYLEHVRLARNIATRMRDTVVILCARPNEPDPDLGYLSLGERFMDVPEARRVVEFVEKPSVTRAIELVAGGALWNTMVTCGTVDALWSLGRSTEPHLIDTLDSLVPLIGTSDEEDAIDYIYLASRSVSFSSDMLQRAATQLAVIELEGVLWSDWGRPERVETVLALRRTPEQDRRSDTEVARHRADEHITTSPP